MNNARRIAAVGLSAALVLGLAACGSEADPVDETNGDGATVIRISATAVPHAQILEFVDENLAADAGIDLEIVVTDDYNIPNAALHDGEVDANYFQHLPFFTTQVEELGYDLDHYEGVHIEPIGLYSSELGSVDEITDGMTIGVPNDPSNQGRALFLLQDQGLITLPADLDATTVTVLDIEDNPLNLNFQEADAAQLPRSLQDVDAAVINGNYALEADLKPSEDAIALESGEDNPYANIVAVRADEKDNEELKKLDELLRSQEVKDFITETWSDGAVIAAF